LVLVVDEDEVAMAQPSLTEFELGNIACLLCVAAGWVVGEGDGLRVDGRRKLRNKLRLLAA
jgi:hypothetical protein